ncbi:MAG: TilS substrate-binding domain-containing protein, partial [Kineosporiaceae bacterium]
LPGDVLAGDALAGDALAGDALPGEALPGDPGPRPRPGSGPGPGPDLDLDVSVLAAAPPAVRRRALLAAIRRAGAPPGAVGRVHVLAVDALVVAWRGQGPAHLPGGIVARRDCGRLLLAARGDGPRGDGRE